MVTIRMVAAVAMTAEIISPLTAEMECYNGQLEGGDLTLSGAHQSREKSTDSVLSLDGVVEMMV